MTVTLATPISSVIGNKRRVGGLKALGVTNCGDALTYYPFRLAPPTPLTPLSRMSIGVDAAFPATVRNVRVSSMGARGSRVEVAVDDADYIMNPELMPGAASLVFFTHKSHYVDYLMGRVRVGARLVVKGTPSVYNDRLQFTHPELLVAGVDCRDVSDGLNKVRLPRPVYHANSRITTDRIHESIVAVLDALEERSAAMDDGAMDGSLLGGDGSPEGCAGASSVGASLAGKGARAGMVARAAGEPNPGQSSVIEPVAGVTTLAEVPDIIPEDVRVDEGLLHRVEAFEAVHRPSSEQRFALGLRTLRFEEAFISQVALLRARADAKRSQAFVCAAPAIELSTAEDLVSENPTAKTSATDASMTGTLAVDASAGEASATATPGAPVTEPPATSAEESSAASPSLVDRFIGSLPFELTDGQRKVIATIDDDMAKDVPMQRLLQGEVGSGKTVVALAAMLRAVDAGYQAVLVAPTQVLAEQHAESVSRMLRKAGLLDEDWENRFGGKGRGRRAEAAIELAADPAATDLTVDLRDGERRQGPRVPVVLLTGGMRLAHRRRVLALAASGDPCIVIATHAAFSTTFQAPRMALAVIDEQHRFGVEQRDALRRKSERSPHLLVMTATPIPRTAAMTWFGDLDISWLTELPGGRKPIRTIVVPEGDGHTMARMFTHLRRRIDAGERAYVVCPAIDDAKDGEDGADVDGADLFEPPEETGYAAGIGEGTGAGRAGAGSDGGSGADALARTLHSVREIAGILAALPQFAGLEIVTLTGRDKEEDKREAMERFASGDAPLMVATTVIEVGVDVPQASCIVIFDADHFGLSQLHQLRGRVGRGGTDAWCFLISRAETGSIAAQRMEVIRDSTDGAQIAAADVELRGAGDVLGDAQAGMRSSFKLLRVVKDADLIQKARLRAQVLLEGDPRLDGHVQLAGAVLDFMRGKEEFLVRS